MTRTPRAFFSYSREDSDFAMRLAADLRSSGAAIWLDQLDIRPGERWDRSVETALADCTRVLLILSPSSVESTNVMDEVSFALEEQKTVIPVLYRPCKIPFRLRRLQYIDFREDYDSALRHLVTILRDEDDHTAQAPVEASPDPSDDVPRREPEPAPRAEGSRRKSELRQQTPAGEVAHRWAPGRLVLVVCVFVVLAGAYAWLQKRTVRLPTQDAPKQNAPAAADRQTPPSPDEPAWQAIAHSGNIAGFESYIARFPAGAHVAEARTRIEELKTKSAPNAAKAGASPAQPLRAAGESAAPSRSAEPSASSPSPASGTFKVLFDTTKGSFEIEVHRDWAPLGAGRFYSLVKSRYFNGSAFFHVVPDFIVHFGLAAKPDVIRIWDTPIKDDPVTQTNRAGSIVFATAGPNTRRTQLFINLHDNPRLDRQGFAPFGMVLGNGMQVVNRIYSGYGDKPNQQTAIESQGNAYLDANFPKLDHIKYATIEH